MFVADAVGTPHEKKQQENIRTKAEQKFELKTSYLLGKQLDCINLQGDRLDKGQVVIMDE